jgi:hypothetical protein
VTPVVSNVALSQIDGLATGTHWAPEAASWREYCIAAGERSAFIVGSIAIVLLP